MPVEGINLVKGKLALAQRLDAFHDVQQPAARLKRFASEKECFLPYFENGVLRTDDAVLDDMYLADLWHLAEQDI